MRGTSSILASTMTASLVAGPVFLLCLLTSIAIESPEELWTVVIRNIGFVPIILLVSASIGLFFAGLPILFGAAVMTWLGWHLPESRSPIVWTAAGAVFGSILSVPVIASFSGPGEGVFLSIMVFTIPGALCALICRRMTSWPDEL